MAVVKVEFDEWTWVVLRSCQYVWMSCLTPLGRAESHITAKAIFNVQINDLTSIKNIILWLGSTPRHDSPQNEY